MLNLIGMGLGPQAVGILSDWFAPEYGAESLRWALLAALSSKGIAIALFLLAAWTTVGDLAKRRAAEQAAAAQAL